MITVNVKFISAEVDSFSLKEAVQIKILFNESSNKQLKFKVPLQKLEEEAHNIVRAVRKYVKETNQTDQFGDGFLDNFVNVVITNEEGVEERLKAFLRKIAEKKGHIAGSRMHSGYMDVINQVKNLKTSF